MGINRHYSSFNILVKPFLLFLVISSSVVCTLALGIESAGTEGRKRAEETEEEDRKHEPNPVERGIGITGFNSHWEAFRAWTKLAWMNIRPPDFRYGQKASGTGEKMKEATKRSFQSGKETVEQAAAAAAKVAEEAVEKTKEKVKGKVSSFKGDPDAEL